MLSRSALGLYWIGRYLERAQHACRLIADQFETMKDRPVDEIDKGWRRLYGGLGRVPVGGALSSNLDDERFMLVDAFTLADDLTFEAGNPDSIRSSLANARENARQVRHVVDEDLWSCLNLAFFDLRDLGIADIWQDRPSDFYRRTEDAVRTFFGIAESNMYRDDGWHFLQLGRFVERAQLLSALLEAQLAVYPAGGPDAGPVTDGETSDGETSDAETSDGVADAAADAGPVGDPAADQAADQAADPDWLSLLRICAARDAYGRLHSLHYDPAAVVDFLVADPLLSRSIRYALAQVCAALDAVSAGRPLIAEAGRRAGRLAALIDYDWPNRDPADEDAIRATLRGIGDSCRRLHDDIDAAYFSYGLGDGEDGP
ncbi:MAG: alpha-E domain-containing protein [Rhodospirillaceae bacterium]|nr:alpha-E domain-containing protein [Rhodospirillaceae bacterium]